MRLRIKKGVIECDETAMEALRGLQQKGWIAIIPENEGQWRVCLTDNGAEILRQERILRLKFYCAIGLLLIVIGSTVYLVYILGRPFWPILLGFVIGVGSALWCIKRKRRKK